MLGIIASKSRRAELGKEPVYAELLITRYLPERVEAGTMLSTNDVAELLGIPLIGVIPVRFGLEMTCLSVRCFTLSSFSKHRTALIFSDAQTRVSPLLLRKKQMLPLLTLMLLPASWERSVLGGVYRGFIFP
jgi:septum formation inhibitor-activating ATPase MinD